MKINGGSVLLVVGVAAAGFAGWYWWKNKSSGSATSIVQFEPSGESAAPLPTTAALPESPTVPVSSGIDTIKDTITDTIAAVTGSSVTTTLTRPSTSLSEADQNKAAKLLAQYAAAIKAGRTAAAKKIAAELKALGVAPTTTTDLKVAAVAV